jgi:N-acetylglutamate synthase-like GNAT family acetyltransferase
LNEQPNGTVLLSTWLSEQGYDLYLQQRYKKNHWLESIGTGAMIRSGDNVGYEGAIYALQKQLGSTIHPGGKTALSLLGKAHFLELSPSKATLFGDKNELLPVWFKRHDWGLKLDYHKTGFLPAGVGMTEATVGVFSIKVSGAVRALMECLYLAPQKQGLMECYELMEGLNNLRPNLVQELLEQCRSVKVKRLFLYMAEKAKHDWFQYLNLEKVDLGSGKRSIVKNGIYNSNYKITVSKELAGYGIANI